MSEKQGFCTNSRRWLVFMDLIGRYPSTCPYDGDCDRCGYFKEREPTSYVLRKMKLVGFDIGAESPRSTPP